MTRFVIIIRHGERLDYVMRDQGNNWLVGQARPWDPPLSERGYQQGWQSGQLLKTRLQQMGLPPISAVYSSPLLRCRQTACAIIKGLENQQNCVNSTRSPKHTETKLKVRVEIGLAESLNESWYRSWALPGSDGTWGFSPPNEHGRYDRVINEATVHPASKVPVQEILLHHEENQPTTTTTNDHHHDGDTAKMMDSDYISKTLITLPYTLFPRHMESQSTQRKRMKTVLDTCAVAGQTIVLVTHGGPSVHAYETLTGNKWFVHGDIKYCGFSIYGSALDVANNNDNDDDEPPGEWKVLVTNESVETLNVKGFTLEGDA